MADCPCRRNEVEADLLVAAGASGFDFDVHDGAGMVFVLPPGAGWHIYRIRGDVDVFVVCHAARNDFAGQHHLRHRTRYADLEAPVGAARTPQLRLSWQGRLDRRAASLDRAVDHCRYDSDLAVVYVQPDSVGLDAEAAFVRIPGAASGIGDTIVAVHPACQSGDTAYRRYFRVDRQLVSGPNRGAAAQSAAVGLSGAVLAVYSWASDLVSAWSGRRYVDPWPKRGIFRPSGSHLGEEGYDEATTIG